jgi:hypothetical protein
VIRLRHPCACSAIALLLLVPAARADFSAEQVLIETGTVERAVAAGDVDGDGSTDLAAVSDTGKLTIELNLAGVSDRKTLTVPAGAAAVATGDLDGDLKADVVTANGASISVIRRTAMDFTVTTIPLPAGTTATGVAIGRLDGDARADIAVLAGAKLIVESQAADGSFTPTTIALAASASQIVVADLDLDGRDDIAVVEPTKLELLLQKPAGGFDVQPVALPGNAATAVAAGDLDGDGDRDLAVADAAGSAVFVLTKSGPGYTATAQFGTGASPNAIAIGDFDNDGTADIATSDAAGVTAILHGYAPKTVAAPSPGSLVPADIDGDRRTDLAMTAAGSTKLTALVNTTPSAATLAVAGPAGGTSFGALVPLTATLTPVVAGQPLGGGAAVRFTVDGVIGANPLLVEADGTAMLIVRGLGVGPHTLEAAYLDPHGRYQAVDAGATHTVTATRTLTGTLKGPIEVTEPTFIHDATITGDVTSVGVPLDIERSTIDGVVDVHAGDGLRICDSLVDGDVTAEGMSGLVVVGDPAFGCTGNRIGGLLTLQGNAGGVRATGNLLARRLFTGNLGSTYVPGQPSDLSGNLGAPLVKPPAGAGALPATVLGATATVAVDLPNGGDGTLHVSGVTVTGDSAFTADAGTCAGPLVPGDRCGVRVHFTPASAGAHAATLRIAADTVTGVITVPLSGRGLTPGTVALSTASLAFPDTTVGATGAEQTVTVTNAGEAPLQLSGDALDGDFRIARDGCGSAVLGPGAACSLDIAFTPGSAGPKTASLRIESSSPTSPDLVALSGTGVAALLAPVTVQPPPPPAPSPSRSGKLALSKLKAGRRGAISFTLALPSAGRYTVTTSRSFAPRRAGTVSRARSVVVKLKPKRAPAKQRRIKITVAFTPAGGQAMRVTRTVTVRP